MPTQLNPSGSIQDQLLNLFLYLGTEWVLYLLLMLSVLSLAVAAERAFYFWRQNDDYEWYRATVNEYLSKGKSAELRTLVEGRRKSYLGRILLHALDALHRGGESTEEALHGGAEVERLRMERGLAFLGTLGSNAPFLGLFGTVLGIIRAFRDLSANTLGGTEAVMAGLAEALVATAVGLLVALPAVAVFNSFQRMVRARLTGADAVGRALLSHAKSEIPV